MNRRQRRRQAAEQRQDERRPDMIALAHQWLTAWAESDPTVSGATPILPSGEDTRLDAELLRRGGKA